MIRTDMLHNVIAQPRFTTDVNTSVVARLPVHTSKGFTIHPEEGSLICKHFLSTEEFPNAYTKRREVPKTVVQNVCSSRNVRKHFTTGQPSLSANLSSLPTSAEQHLHTTDILKNRRTTDTNDTITLRPTKVETTITVSTLLQSYYNWASLFLYKSTIHHSISQRLVVWTMDMRHQNLFEGADPFGMSAPAGAELELRLPDVFTKRLFWTRCISDVHYVEQLRRETLPILETLRAKIKVAEDLIASHSSSSSLLGFEQQVEQLRGDYEALTVKIGALRSPPRELRNEPNYVQNGVEMNEIS
ncbi:hypothetical protein Tco_0327056 [Tanacetum coccineum]